MKMVELAAGGEACTEIDRQYSPSLLVGSLQNYLDDYARKSAIARKLPSCRVGLRYGSSDSEKLDFWLGPNRHSPLVVFVHGGNWAALDESDSAFLAQPLQQYGYAFAALGYGLAPAKNIEEMVQMVRRAVFWLKAQATALNFDPGKVVLVGTSAGAHLAAMATAYDSLAAPNLGLRRLVLLSGIYDLNRVLSSYVNSFLKLDMSRAFANSPVNHIGPHFPSTTIARGGIETDEYVWHHNAMRESLRKGGVAVREIVEPNRNHFDLPYDLAKPGTALYNELQFSSPDNRSRRIGSEQ